MRPEVSSGSPPCSRHGTALGCLLAMALPLMVGCSGLGSWFEPVDRVIDAQQLRSLGMPSAPGGNLELYSRRFDDVRLTGRFDHAAYNFSDPQTAIVVMWEGDLEDPKQALVMRLLWRPRAGSE